MALQLMMVRKTASEHWTSKATERVYTQAIPKLETRCPSLFLHGVCEPLCGVVENDVWTQVSIIDIYYLSHALPITLGLSLVICRINLAV